MPELTPVADTFKNPGIGLTPVQVGNARPLGVAVRPPNSTVAVIGDSQGQHNASVTGGFRRTLAYGAAVWMGILSRQRVSFDPSDCWAVAAQDTAQILNGNPGVISSLPSVIASYGSNVPGIFVVDAGTNDIPHGLTLAQSQANVLNIISLIRATGAVVLWILPTPRDITAAGFTMTTAQGSQFVRLVDWMKTVHSPTNGIWMVDSWEGLADPASTNMAMLSTVQYDGLHRNQYGQYLVGLALARIVGLGRADGILPYTDVLRPARSPFNAYDPINYPGGFLNLNPTMQGSGGGVSTSWTGNDSSTGLVTTKSKTTLLTGETAQQLAIAGTPANQNFGYFYQNPLTASNLAVGDVVEGFCDFEMDAGLTGLNCLGLILQDNTSFLWSMTLDQSSDIIDQPMPPVAWQGVLRLPRFTLTSTGVRFGLGWKARSSLPAVSATCRMGVTFLRKVVS